MEKERRREIRRYLGMLAVALSSLGLGTVADPRAPGRARTPLWQMLTASLAGLMAGCHSLKDVELLTKQLSLPVRHALKLFRRLPDTTMRDLLVRLDLDELRAVLRRMTRLAHRRKQLRPHGLPFGTCAIDGRSGVTRCPDDYYAQHRSDSAALVRTMTASLSSAQAPICIDSMAIPGHQNEMSAFAKFLQALVGAYGTLRLFRVVTADAGITSEANARLIRSYGLHYVLALKENQPTLLGEAMRLLGRRSAEEADSETVDRIDNNTVCVRRVWLSTEMADYLEWDHLRVVLRVQREVRRDDGTVISCDERYFASSLELDKLTPEQWGRIIRWHWKVENDCHNVLDTRFREDDQPWLYATFGALVVMLLRRIALNVLMLYRNVARRGERKADVPWAELFSWMRVGLTAASEDDVHGLRWPIEISATGRAPPGSPA